MNKEQLKKLQEKRILNMTRIYESIGESSATISTKLSRPFSRFSKDKLTAIEVEIINSISEVVHLTDIDLIKLISMVLTNCEYHIQAKQVLDNLSILEVMPVGYVHGKQVQAIYLTEDQYKPRSSDHNSTARFMDKSQLFGLKEKVELTDRGRNLLMDN